jgi:DNA-binding CsgD family transcriptional regulator
MGGYRRGPDTPTDRQIQILRLVAEGKSDEQIGRELFIERTTVSDHISLANIRIGANGRSHLLAIAFRKGWIE